MKRKHLIILHILKNIQNQPFRFFKRQIAAWRIKEMRAELGIFGQIVSQFIAQTSKTFPRHHLLELYATNKIRSSERWTKNVSLLTLLFLYRNFRSLRRLFLFLLIAIEHFKNKWQDAKNHDHVAKAAHAQIATLTL